MRLLVMTQAVDRTDPVLGFFHLWLEELARRYEKVSVICLKEDDHQLPSNVRVYSLGKEMGESRLKYLLRFYRYVWQLRHEYDAVFVHMNQEYVLLGGLLWKALGKKIFLWRNHYAGSFLTGIAVAVSTKVFCTSKSSYTARYKKTVLMPVGVDLTVFRPEGVRTPRSILFLARFAPSKNPGVLLDALSILKERGVAFSASFYGSPLPRDAAYWESEKRRAHELGLSGSVTYYEGVPNSSTPRIYSAHEIFVNCSASGMYDKTIFEAAACGALSMAASLDYSAIADPRLSFDGTARDLAVKLGEILALPALEKEHMQKECRIIAERNSLHTLGARLLAEVH